MNHHNMTDTLSASQGHPGTYSTGSLCLHLIGTSNYGLPTEAVQTK